MKDKTYLRTLMEWNTWANDVTYRKVSELPPEEITKQRKTPLESIFVSLHHLLNVDDVWLHHMQGKKHDYEGLRVTRIADFDTLWARRKEMDRTLEAYVGALSAEDLEEIVDYELIGGNKGAMSRAMCLTHLALHGSYHRGWISDMFGQAGAMQPTTDLPVFERALRTEKGVNLPR
jgi:uncharacterized damage-inducible protein DinB